MKENKIVFFKICFILVVVDRNEIIFKYNVLKNINYFFYVLMCVVLFYDDIL